MPDATRQRDWTPDVTAGNQDSPGQMNQPQDPALGGDNWPSHPGQVVESTQPTPSFPSYEDMPEVRALPEGGGDDE